MRRTPEVDDIVVLPGRYFIGGRNCRMQTVPGPGVAITLWNRDRRIGAMAHFSLAADGALELDGHNAWDGLQLLLQGLRWSQIEAADCAARICGGGTLRSHMDRVPSLNSGQSAGEWARRLLRAYGLPIVSESFYAVGRHRIVFDINTGRLQARRVKPVVVAIDAKPRPVSYGVMRRRRGSALG